MNIINSLGTTDLISIIVSIILVYIARFYYKYFTRPNPLPGPVPLPIVGNFLSIFYYGKGDVALWLKLLQEKHGDIYEIYLGSLRRIVFARADYVEKLMSPFTKTNYVLRFEHMPVFDELKVSGKGIVFNADIPTWRINRQLFSQAVLTPSFSKEALHRNPIIFNELNEYWKEIGQNVSIDFSKWIRKFTTESIFQLVVGLKVSSMAKYFNDSVELSKRKFIESNPIDKNIINFDQIIDARIKSTPFILNVPAFLRHTIFKKRNDEIHENRNETRKIIMKIIDHRRKEIEDHKELGSDMLTLLITANTEQIDEQHSKPLTNDQIFQILIEAIIGGIESTANLLCFIVYHIAHYPNILARMREELDTIFGSENNHQITMEDLSKMHYTDSIIKECARLINPSKLT
ncbi:2298_t:CDS:1 [Funneliformis geosporum]|uniref:17963_t:CDS:1 n=1 Tax=Funneliformis geosporum TaxID=1117311 RepID=A0A9W4SB05_9GLOM|nr:17963_t:CDS:1 [Funneliformis geosporum]CAI2184124.1 2298_t:CDS:1 [Funneliformis geosporum]